MTNAGVNQLLYLFDQAFDGEDWHSISSNLRDVPLDAWNWIPPRGDRSIRDVVQHVGSCKFMYENHAFGDATLTWDDALVRGDGALETIESATAWIREGHTRLRRNVTACDDEDLNQQRPTNWGETRELRWIISTMIQHDLYHAGEINLLRSLHQGDDRWAHDRE